MSDIEAQPMRGLSQSLARAGLSVLAIYAILALSNRDRLEDDCGCTPATGWAVSIGAALIVLGIAGWLLCAVVPRRWRETGYTSIWPFLADQWHHVRAAGVPWVIASMGIVLLTVPSQTADMLAGLGSANWTDSEPRLFPFAAGAGAWAMSTWFCGRWSIDIEDQTAARQGQWLATWNPRLLALGTGVAIVFIVAKAAGLCSPASIVASLLVSFVFLVALLRRDVWCWLDRDWQPAGRARLQIGRGHADSEKPWYGRFADDMRAAPGGMAAVLIVLLLSIAVLATYGIAPAIAKHLEAPGTVLLGLACLTTIATFLTKARRQIARWPVLLGVAILTMVLGRFDLGVDHDIRTLDTERKFAAPSIQEAATDWLTHCGERIWDQKNNELRVVLVSTAGGASRAALWTFHALSALEDKDPLFPHRVFSVSAVSGGAVGATVWSALLAQKNFDCAIEGSAQSSAAQRREDGHEILKGDFLAPVLAAWLARDIPLGVVPLNLLVRWLGGQIEDRAAALEHAWEDAWTKQISPGQTHLLKGDFRDLWGPSFNRPLLLLNGTVEDAGLPVLTAPVSINEANGTSRGEFPATYDALWMAGTGIRASTAALNAARFPVVSPQGDIRIRRCPDGTVARKGQCTSGTASPEQIVSLVDGGYFDNIGGGTTMRAADALRAAFAAHPVWQSRATRLRIMVAGISSNPDLRITREDWDRLRHPKREPVDQLMRCGQKAPTLQVGGKGIGNALDAQIAPILAIVATQSGHTVSRMAELNRRFCGNRDDEASPDRYIVLSLCPVKDTPLPLNWVMPPATRAFFANHGEPIAKTLPGMCGNETEIPAYKAWAQGPKPKGG